MNSSKPIIFIVLLAAGLVLFSFSVEPYDPIIRRCGKIISAYFIIISIILMLGGNV